MVMIMSNTNTNNHTVEFIGEPCSYEHCLKCHCVNCWTGQVAREKGRKGYDEMLEMLATAE